MPASYSGSREKWRQQVSFLATQTDTAPRVARKFRQLLPLPRALEIADVVAARSDGIPAQLHKGADKERCYSAVVDVKLVAKLAERLVLQREIVVEAGLELPQVRTPIPPRLEHGMSGSRFPTEELPIRI